MIDAETYRERLTARLDELVERLDTIEEELESHNSRDWEELAVEREGDEVLEDLGNSGQEEIKAIRAALARIESGEFGFCMKCGEEISAERLDVLPQTPFCRKCA